MTRRVRLDAELVRRGLARSREDACTLISEGRVRVAGSVATKPATAVDTAAAVVVTEAPGAEYVSRGAHKLVGALNAFGPLGLTVADRTCLDAGASTGGFTQVLLQRGAGLVHAVDVGYGQLDWSLRNDPRVVVRERTNVRSLTPDDLGGVVDVVVADLSFISLSLVLPALTACAPGGDLCLMVKPQFEVGKGRVGAGGVVRDPELRAEAVRHVAATALSLGWGTHNVTASPLPGPSGNVEYFAWFAAGAPPLDPNRLEQAISEGPG